jgi:hypothetical protein
LYGDRSAALVDFSRKQPEQPNPWFILGGSFSERVSAAGAKETELQGASSVVRRNALADGYADAMQSDAIQSET